MKLNSCIGDKTADSANLRMKFSAAAAAAGQVSVPFGCRVTSFEIFDNGSRLVNDVRLVAIGDLQNRKLGVNRLGLSVRIDRRNSGKCRIDGNRHNGQIAIGVLRTVENGSGQRFGFELSICPG